MAKTNRKTKGMSVTTNMDGHKAYKLSPKLELTQRVATWFVNEPKFYGDNATENKEILELVGLVARQDPEFILKLAVYARETLLLRQAPVVLLVEASLNDNTKQYVRQYSTRILTRADQMTEAVAYLQQRIGNIGDLAQKGSMPASLKKGLADVIRGMSDYALSKYKAENSAVKLRDVIMLTRPRPISTEQGVTFKKILENKLEPAETWETYISAHGSTKESWTAIAPKMGYMALLRNLRNFVEKGVDMDRILAKLTSEESVRSSKQYPFRFLSAYREMMKVTSFDTKRVLAALEHAMELSVENLPRLKGRTAIWADHSGSMKEVISEKSTMERLQTADIMLAIANRICEKAITGVFSDVAHTVQVPDSNLLQSSMTLRKAIPISGTNMASIFERMSTLEADRIIILTDEEANQCDFNKALQEYRAHVNPNARMYVMNLAGYGTTQIPESDNKACHLAGFTEKVFNLIPIFEEAGNGMVEKIEQINPS